MEQTRAVPHADDRLMLDRLLAAFEHLSESIVLTDPQDRFVIANRAFREINRNVAHAIQPGQKFEDYLRAGLAAGNYPDAVGREHEWLEARLAERRNPGSPVERQRSGGRWYRIEDRRLPDGSTIRFGTEITERKLTEQSLRSSKERFRQTFELAASGIAHVDLQGCFTRVNRSLCRTLGYSSAEMVGRTVREFSHPEDRGVTDSARARMRTGEIESEHFEKRYLHNDGSIVWVDLTVALVRDAGGRPEYEIAVFDDITERKRAEQLLRIEHQVTRALSDAEDAATGVQAVLRVVCEAVGVGCGRFFKLEESAGVLRFHDGWCLPQAAYEDFLENSRPLVFRPGEGLAGIVWQTGEPIWSADTSRDPRVLGKSLAQNSDIRAAFAFAVRSEGKVLGVLSFSGQTAREPDDRLLQAARVIGSQIGQFLKRKQAEESLRNREQMFAALLRNMPGDVYRCRNDRDWTMEYVSEGVLELTGYSPSAFTIERRVTYDSLVHPGDRDRIWREAQAALAERRPYTIEYRIRDAHGTEKWVWERGSGDYASDGSVIALDGFVADITARKRAEEALRLHADRLKIGQSVDGMIVLDWDIRNDRLEWSDSPEWLRGPLPPDGKYPLFKDQVHPDDRENFLATRARTIRTLHGETPQFRFVSTDGRVRWIQSRQRLFADDSGKAVRMLVALHDITEYKEKEQALAASEARFRAIFERSSAGMAITDAGGAYLSVNAAFARFFGYPAEDLVGKMKVSDLRSADDAEGAVLYQRLVSGEIGFFERDQSYRRKDGAQIWGRVTVSAVRDTGGKAAYVVAVFSDITEEVRARSRIERMNAELEERVETRTAELREAMKELDAFTYSVSHDLRAPIGAVSGFAHLLRNAEAERLSDDGLRLLGFIEHNAERMARLIEGLLRFSRLGRSDLHRTRVSMNGLAAESLLDFVDEAARARIAAGSMPECNGDPALLSQVWSNLIGNALKYSRGADAPCIDIGWDAARNAYFVRDNGAGFDMAYAGKLFGVFERLHAESEFEGSGIGLAIAERIIRLHGGTVWADAAPGQGATFWFTVPALVNGAPPEARSWEN